MISIGDPFESAGGSAPRKSAMVGMTSRSVTTPALRVESEVSDPSSPRSANRLLDVPRASTSGCSSSLAPIISGEGVVEATKTSTDPSSTDVTISTIMLATPSSPPSRLGSSHRKWTFCSPGAMPASPSVGNPFCSVISAAPPLVARAATSGIPSISSNETPGTRKTKTSPVSPLTCARAEVEAKPPATMSGSRSAPRRARVTTGPGSVRARGGRRRRAPPAWPPSPGSRGRRGTYPRSRSRRRP